MMQQLPLGISLHDHLTFANYIAGDNRRLVKVASRMAVGDDMQLVYVWAPKGLGKTHILQAACNLASTENKASVYIPLKDKEYFSTDILAGIENLTIACIDDLDCVAGDPKWEEALFHLFNKVKASNTRLLVSSKFAPNQIPLKLMDLKSRLAWFIPFMLESLGDEQKLMALQLRAKSRGFELEPSVGKFLLNRCPRNMHSLFAALEKLDFATLAQKRKLTVPFVKEVMGF